VASVGQAGIGIEAPGIASGGRQREAYQPHQRRVLHQIIPQIAHGGQFVIYLDQAGGSKGGIGHGTHVGAQGEVSFWEPIPGQGAQ